MPDWFMPQAKKLLVLEEGERIGPDLAVCASKSGFEIARHRDAADVLAAGRQVQADAFVIDALLRGAGSVAAIKALRRNVNSAGIPIVAVAAKAGPTCEQLLGAGAQACHPDPFDAVKVIALVEQHLQDELDFTAAPMEVLAAPPRLQALAASKMMDAPAEPAFDRLTRLASQLLVAPVTLASFVSADRQFFKSEQGLPSPWKEKRETPLTHSFCQWVVTSNEPLVVDDARKHAVLKSNRAIVDLNVAAYCGVPVASRGGQALGSMCAIDSRPRTWTPEDLATLQDLALVTQAYVEGSPARHRDAIAGAVRMLRRYGARLRDREREALLDIVDEQAMMLAPR
jgi:hypothetical protein